uniref:elicitor-responsive protein 3 n=1 Tax=Fragaria vesca subsp. vesca TaxID=101020 RepID=UPI0005CAD5C4|nr:PREDICTED: elicitor-responsive protein 3 [Fragaria vesca subsp. vesca]
MKGGGSLEVLLVDAEDIRHTNVLGKPAYYVILECGTQVYRTKISSEEDDKVTWNEKFTFEFSDWKHLTHLKFRIMDTEMFTDGGFVGETMIHIGGIITEGKDRGFIEVKPSPYNVVLEDDTYKGEIKIGFKFVANKAAAGNTREYLAQNNKPKGSISKTIANFWKVLWWRILFCQRTESNNNQKQS